MTHPKRSGKTTICSHNDNPPYTDSHNNQSCHRSLPAEVFSPPPATIPMNHRPAKQRPESEHFGDSQSWPCGLDHKNHSANYYGKQMSEIRSSPDLSDLASPERSCPPDPDFPHCLIHKESIYYFGYRIKILHHTSTSFSWAGSTPPPHWHLLFYR